MKQDRDEESMNYILPNQIFKSAPITLKVKHTQTIRRL